MYLRCTKKLQTIIIISFISINPSMTLVFKFPNGKVKVKFTVEQAMKAQSGSRGIGLLFL
jgi:hypothetical protein